jgi:hypothetical protein
MLSSLSIDITIYWKRAFKLCAIVESCCWDPLGVAVSGIAIPKWHLDGWIAALLCVVYRGGLKITLRSCSKSIAVEHKCGEHYVHCREYAKDYDYCYYGFDFVHFYHLRFVFLGWAKSIYIVLDMLSFCRVFFGSELLLRPPDLALVAEEDAVAAFPFLTDRHRHGLPLALPVLHDKL